MRLCFKRCARDCHVTKLLLLVQCHSVHVLSDAPGLCHNLIVLDMQDKPEAVGPGVVVRSHGALSWEEPELLEQAGDDQESPILR